MNRTVFFIFFAMLLCLPTYDVQAQAVLEMFQKGMPKIKLLSKGAFLAETSLREEFPIGAEHLSYELRIPKDWGQADDIGLSSLVVSDQIMSSLAKYLGPVTTTGVRHHMTVQVIGIRHQMTAKYWLMRYALENKYTVQGIKSYDPRRAELLYIFVVDDVSYVARAIVQINGKNLVFVQHFLPLDQWHEHKVMQAQVLNSFKLKFKSEDNIEKMLTHYFLDIAEFLYPESWVLKAGVVPSVDRMKVKILSLSTDRGEESKKILTGRIGLEMVSVYATDGVDEEIDRFKKELVRRGLFVQNEILDNSSSFFDEDISQESAVLSETHVFKMLDKNRGIKEYESWITIMAHNNYYYFATLLTPSRDNDFFEWSRNIQTYRFVTDHFLPREKGIDLNTK